MPATAVPSRVEARTDTGTRLAWVSATTNTKPLVAASPSSWVTSETVTVGMLSARATPAPASPATLATMAATMSTAAARRGRVLLPDGTVPPVRTHRPGVGADESHYGTSHLDRTWDRIGVGPEPARSGKISGRWWPRPGGGTGSAVRPRSSSMPGRDGRRRLPQPTGPVAAAGRPGSPAVGG